jgi:hypothetical protein
LLISINSCIAIAADSSAARKMPTGLDREVIRTDAEMGIQIGFREDRIVAFVIVSE